MVVSLGAWWRLRASSDIAAGNRNKSATADVADITRTSTPKPSRKQAEKQSAGQAADDSAAGRAQRAVTAMSLEEQAGQLVMAPMFAGSDPSALQSLIADRHVGSIVLLGNWNNGTTGVRTAVDALQTYAPAANKLIVSADQEGGLVQHLKGTGFDTMPSAVAQGQMTPDALRQSAAGWGAQLKQAGVDVDLAPVLGTVQVARASNAPIGALNRDFGLDAAGNAQHGAAFVEGLRTAGVGGTVKHYPGLGAVTGNTDFTAQGILDTTTTMDGDEIGAFNTVIRKTNPSMVMMSLATYQRIDPSAPAAFSSTIIDDTLRGSVGYQGVVISDSLSAAAVSSVPSGELGVRLIDAGGDLACLGETSLVQPVLDGIIAKANTDPAFAKKVTASATRVMTLKYQLGLAS
ncbi:glycoside hydrolase family 3 N-terminal domain-containing protein [Bifidobacterium leontopitheci]|uniref:beta-N-acetylhexosaminidase n=1 Tax=Bifidobacterium leontopitheci TaxID=2650774 RepID=A0A6I1GDL9_9BIFI|nr:beta-glucosidase [Bifidobacterium leontopitheci]